MLTKLKSYLANDHLFYGFTTFVLVALSFGLGRLSAAGLPSAGAQNIPKYQTELAPESKESFGSKVEVLPATTSEGVGRVVGSKSGTRYHAPTCPGAKQIKPENLIEFTSPAAAAAAGYKPAANCPEVQ